MTSSQSAIPGQASISYTLELLKECAADQYLPVELKDRLRAQIIRLSEKPGHFNGVVPIELRELSKQFVDETRALMVLAAESLERRDNYHGSLKAAQEALEEIAEGKGPFSRDPLTHASNTIDAMKAIASAALSASKGGAS